MSMLRLYLLVGAKLMEQCAYAFYNPCRKQCTYMKEKATANQEKYECPIFQKGVGF